MRIGFIWALVLVSFSACSVPKVMNQSGRVAPKGTVAGGATYMANVSQESSVVMTDVVKSYIINYQPADSVQFDKFLMDANAAILAYAIDPLTFGPQFYLRVGVWDRLELGYNRGKKTNMFSLQGQFLGFEKERVEESKKLWFGSAGVQFSWNNYNLPRFLGNVQSALGFEYKRRDFLFPLNFSYSFGPNEEYGALAFGAVLGLHRIAYSFIPGEVFNNQGNVLKPVTSVNQFHSIGFFVNVKVGYEYIYLIPSFATYYQRYGSYPLLDQSTIFLKGFTFVPGISIQFNSKQKKRDK